MWIQHIDFDTDYCVGRNIRKIKIKRGIIYFFDGLNNSVNIDLLICMKFCFVFIKDVKELHVRIQGKSG